jgi:replicative DNA helicase
MLSDLRESGAIEQDADIVMFIHKPDIYDANAEKDEVEMIVAKHRNGKTGTLYFEWVGEEVSFRPKLDKQSGFGGERKKTRGSGLTQISENAASEAKNGGATAELFNDFNSGFSGGEVDAFGDDYIPPSE